jgi:hypothetical protein
VFCSWSRWFWSHFLPDFLGVNQGGCGGNVLRFLGWSVGHQRLNYRVITLVPKLKEANTIKQFKPYLSAQCGLQMVYQGSH